MRKTHRYLVLAAVAAVSASAQATQVTWSGTGTSWNDAAQWSPAQVPVSGDEAIFTNTNTSGKTFSLDVPQTVTQLTIGATNAFTIGAAADNTAGYKLTLTNVTRNDISGTEGNHTIAAGVILAADSVWDISGSGSLAATGGIGGTGYSVTKRGTGTLTIGTTAASYTGATVVERGTLSVNASIASSSGLIIGGAGYSASVSLGGNQYFNKFTIRSGGTLNEGSNVLYPLTVVMEGGTWNAGQVYPTNNASYTLSNGALITGGYGLTAWAFNGSVTIPATSTSTVTWATTMRVGNNYTAPFNVGDGASPIDFIVSAGISNSATSGFNKNGTGVMQLTSNSNTFSRPVNITAGTLLVDNSDITKSATGQGVVTVSAGATLGGAGSIGGGYATSAINLANGSAGSRATIAPGSISNSTGDALVGTLTVGTATQSNNVTFGSYAQLLEQVGNAGSNDRLTIYGNLSLAAANDVLALQQVAGSTLAGEYTLASFTGTLTGRFDSQTLNGGSLGALQLQYRDASNQVVAGTGDVTGGGSIVLVVPEPGTLLLAGGMMVGALVMRRRSIA